ncbi:uncharacterized protein LOC106151990 isoform X1 [Lingula anatina]|uniref:Uncharacterized protein LOC106151990 isoform X1 n=2 Tax=Lingula anatina TaxID=7574 RepID=A0A2R2MMR3_LINAN|nr:uncharacterized protein LOC106151990 isoform X1 [Lingula anatina]|eukprot:XP_023931523.1 uncharacterized protein LOC106151990 isoform X1 [Lingula anatina]
MDPHMRNTTPLSDADTEELLSGVEPISNVSSLHSSPKLSPYASPNYPLNPASSEAVTYKGRLGDIGSPQLAARKKLGAAGTYDRYSSDGPRSLPNTPLPSQERGATISTSSAYLIDLTNVDRSRSRSLNAVDKPSVNFDVRTELFGDTQRGSRDVDRDKSLSELRVETSGLEDNRQGSRSPVTDSHIRNRPRSPIRDVLSPRNDPRPSRDYTRTTLEIDQGHSGSRSRSELPKSQDQSSYSDVYSAPSCSALKSQNFDSALVIGVTGTPPRSQTSPVSDVVTSMGSKSNSAEKLYAEIRTGRTLSPSTTRGSASHVSGGSIRQDRLPVSTAHKSENRLTSSDRSTGQTYRSESTRSRSSPPRTTTSSRPLSPPRSPLQSRSVSPPRSPLLHRSRSPPRSAHSPRPRSPPLRSPLQSRSRSPSRSPVRGSVGDVSSDPTSYSHRAHVKDPQSSNVSSWNNPRNSRSREDSWRVSRAEDQQGGGGGRKGGLSQSPGVAAAQATIQGLLPPSGGEMKDVSHVTSDSIREMEQVRGHLNTMLKTSVQNVLDKSTFDPVDDVTSLLDSTTVDSPGTDLTSHLEKVLGLPPGWGTERGGPRGGSGHSRSSGYRNDVTLLSENQVLRETLEKERYRRKHCERQIQHLQSKMLETQQQLAVAVSTDKKKDIMIEQLDKTLAKVAEGWKRREAEKEDFLAKLNAEKQAAEKALAEQQEMLSKFEREMQKAVDDLTAEQKRAALAEKERKQQLIRHEEEYAIITESLEAERDCARRMESERDRAVEGREHVAKQLESLQETLNEERTGWQKREREIGQQLEELTTTQDRIVQQEKSKAEEHMKIAQESQDVLASVQKELQQLKIDLDTACRERDHLKVEMGLSEARLENAKRKLEADLQSDLEKQTTSKLAEVHEKMAQSEGKIREEHRKQVQELNQRHSTEMARQLQSFNQELQRKEAQTKEQLQAYEDRLSQMRAALAEERESKQKLESARREMTGKLQELLQGHCSDALSILSRSNSTQPLQSQLTHSAQSQPRQSHLTQSDLSQPTQLGQQSHLTQSGQLSFTSTLPGSVQSSPDKEDAFSLYTSRSIPSRLTSRGQEGQSLAQGALDIPSDRVAPINKFLKSFPVEKGGSISSSADLRPRGGFDLDSSIATVRSANLPHTSSVQGSSVTPSFNSLNFQSQDPDGVLLPNSSVHGSSQLGTSIPYQGASSLNYQQPSRAVPSNGGAGSMIYQQPGNFVQSAGAGSLNYQQPGSANYQQPNVTSSGAQSFIYQQPLLNLGAAPVSSASQQLPFSVPHNQGNVSVPLTGKPGGYASMSTSGYSSVQSELPQQQLQQRQQLNQQQHFNVNQSVGQYQNMTQQKMADLQRWIQQPQQGSAPDQGYASAGPFSGSVATFPGMTQQKNMGEFSSLQGYHDETASTFDPQQLNNTDLSMHPLDDTASVISSLKGAAEDYSHISDKFDAHESRQNELRHYIKVLLGRSPGSPLQDPAQPGEDDNQDESKAPVPAPQQDPRVGPGGETSARRPPPRTMAFMKSVITDQKETQKPPLKQAPLTVEQVDEITRLLDVYRGNGEPQGQGHSEGQGHQPSEEVISYLRGVQGKSQQGQSPPSRGPSQHAAGRGHQRSSSPKARRQLDQNYSQGTEPRWQSHERKKSSQQPGRVVKSQQVKKVEKPKPGTVKTSARNSLPVWK